MTSPHESLFDSRENAPERLLAFADRASQKIVASLALKETAFR
jgi:hypothetical protein